MKARKRTALLLGLMLLLALLSACNTQAPTEQPTKAAETESAATEEPQATATPEAAEEVTLKVFGPATGASFPDGVQTDPVAEQIKKDIGIIIDLDAHPDDAKLNAMLASGDLPDVLDIFDTASDKAPSILKRMINGSLVQPLDDLIAEHGKDILATSADMVEFCRDVYGVDGKLYNLQGYTDPPPTKGFDSGIGPVIRFDYWAELGYPEIKSGDDWLNVVDQMLKAHPTTDVGEKRYGFSPFFEWGWQAALFHWGDIVKGLEGKGVVTGRGGYMEFDLETQTVSDFITNTDSAMWAGVRFLNKANQMGLIDPDIFINKWDTVIQKTSADRVLSSDWTWAYGDINAKLKDTAKGYALVPMQTTSFVEGTASPMGASFRLWVIPTAAKNPQASMKFLNYLYSYEGARTLAAGILGEHYVEKDGKLMVPKTVIDARQADGNWNTNTGIGKYGNYMGLGPSTIDPKYGQKVGLGDPTDLEVVPELTAFEQAYCAYFKIDRPAEIYAGLKIATFNGTTTAIMATTPDDIKEIDNNISDYLGVELQNLIVAKTDAEFQAGMERIIADCKEKGLEQSDAFWTQTWNDALTKVGKYS